MTDQELKDLVASLAIGSQKVHEAQLRTEAQSAKTEAQLAKTDAQLAKTDAQLAKTDAQLAKTDAQLAETDAEIKELAKTMDARSAKIDAQLAKTDAEIKKLAKTMGSFGRNLGEITEEFFYNSLRKKRILAGIKYDFVARHWKCQVDTIEDEYDIIMVNGTDIVIIEVKYQAHVENVTTLITKKHHNFRILFPAYQNYRYHLGLATFALSDEVKKMALDNGVIVLQRVGKVMETFIPITN